MDVNFCLNILAASILFLALACQFSSFLRFYIKSFSIYAFLLLNGVVTIPYGLLHFGQFHENRLFACRWVDWMSSLLGIRWKIECDEEVDKKKSFIIVCNHQSSIDVLGMMKIWSTLGPTVALAKSELKYLAGPFSLALHLCGTIFIDRKSSEGRRAINEASLIAKNSGTSMWIFPEGTRNRKRDRSMLPFKKGAFHMAIDAGLPILPVVISQYDFFNPKEKRFDCGEATIRVLKPISTEGFTKDNLDSLIEITRDSMIGALQMSGNNNKKDS